MQKFSDSKREYWHRQFKQQRASGLSQRAYCRREGLSISQFSYWHGKVGEPVGSPQLEFVEVPLRLTGAATGSIEIIVNGCYTVRVDGQVHEQQLIGVLKALESLR